MTTKETTQISCIKSNDLKLYETEYKNTKYWAAKCNSRNLNPQDENLSGTQKYSQLTCPKFTAN